MMLSDIGRDSQAGEPMRTEKTGKSGFGFDVIPEMMDGENESSQGDLENSTHEKQMQQSKISVSQQETIRTQARKLKTIGNRTISDNSTFELHKGDDDKNFFDSSSDSLTDEMNESAEIINDPYNVDLRRIPAQLANQEATIYTSKFTEQLKAKKNSEMESLATKELGNSDVLILKRSMMTEDVDKGHSETPARPVERTITVQELLGDKDEEHKFENLKNLNAGNPHAIRSA